jgi:phosphate/sulfate permease
MPPPGSGTVTSLSYMAQFLRQKNNPNQGYAGSDTCTKPFSIIAVIRSTGVAFCNGAARIITSFGPLIAGLLAAALGGFSVAAAIMVCFALLSVVAMLIGRETKGSELPR